MYFTLNAYLRHFFWFWFYSSVFVLLRRERGSLCDRASTPSCDCAENNNVAQFDTKLLLKKEKKRKVSVPK